MRLLRIALGAAVGLGATWVAIELWKLLVQWEVSREIHFSHALNEVVSFLPVVIVTGYLLWRIHQRVLGVDVIWSTLGTAVLVVAVALLSDPSGGRLLLIWAVSLAVTLGPLAVVAFLSSTTRPRGTLAAAAMHKPLR